MSWAHGSTKSRTITKGPQISTGSNELRRETSQECEHQQDKIEWYGSKALRIPLGSRSSSHF